MSVNNTVILMGRLGRDPETKHSANGKQITKFSLAVDDGFGDKKETFWFNCVCFGKTAEAIDKHVKKGDALAISGKGSFNKWTDKDGRNRIDFEVIVFQWQYQQGSNSKRDAAPSERAQEDHQAAKQDGYTPPAQGQGDFDDGTDIPFRWWSGIFNKPILA